MDHLNVLVVNNSRLISERIMVSPLKMIGYNNFLDASDELLARMQLLQEDSIHIIIFCWGMPKLSVLPLIKDIRNFPDRNSDNDIPIVVVVEKHEEEYMKEIIEAKAAYIVKPFTPLQLKEKVEEVMKNRQ